MKSKTLYRDILKKSFIITFKNKILWFFGLLAAPLIGIVEYKILAISFGELDDLWIFSEWNRILGIFRLDIIRRLLIINPTAVVILLMIFVLSIFFIFFLIWLAIVAQCSLIDAVSQSDPKSLTTSKIQGSIASGISNFLPVFGVHFFVKLAFTLSFFLISLPMIIIAIGGKGIELGILYFIFSLFLIPITMIIIFVSKYAINYIVIRKENFFDGIKKGYNLFVENWLVTIEMSIILFLISMFFVGFLVAVVVSFMILPFGFLIYIFAQIGLIFLLEFSLILAFIFLILLSLFLAAVLSTFQYSSWVLLFKRLDSSNEKEAGKLVRWFSFNR